MQVLLHTDFLLNACSGEAVAGGGRLLDLCRQKKVKAWVAASALPAVAGQTRNPSAAGKLQAWLDVVSILPLTGTEIRESLFSPDLGVEESLALRAVRALGLAGIVTLDAAAFGAADVRTFHPDDLPELAEGRAVDSVALIDLPAAYHEFWEDLDRGLAGVVRSGGFILGPRVAELETKIAAYCQCRYAVGVSSGTDALMIALMAAGVGPGDEVVTTPYTFFATLGSIARLGARPVLADIEPASCNIDPDRVAEKIGGKTRAILPVHLYGQCADMDPILDLAKKHKLTVIEDAAQAIGSEYKFKRAGSLGDYGCFSFFPTKNLGGLGDGGMVTTNSEAAADRLRLLRVHGSRPKYHHKIVGGNFRLDALQAAAVAAKLKYLEGWHEKRRQHAATYNRLIGERGLADTLRAPQEIFPRHIYHQYVIRVPERRDELMAFLKQKGVGAEVYYPVPMHLQECFAGLGYRRGDFPESEKAAAETLALPISPELTAEQQEYVVAVIGDFFDKR